MSDGPQKGRYPLLLLVDSGEGATFTSDTAGAETAGQSVLVSSIDVAVTSSLAITGQVELAIDTFTFYGVTQTPASASALTWSWRGDLLLPGNRVLYISGSNTDLTATWGCQVTGYRFPI